MNNLTNPIKIAIIGAGFSGTSLAAHLNQLAAHPIEIMMFEKVNDFGMGAAYATPYPHHLLNVLAKDMSAFEQAPDHFVNWLQTNPVAVNHLDPDIVIENQFVPRFLYGAYLKSLLDTIIHHKKISLTLVSAEITEIIPVSSGLRLMTATGSAFNVNKAILAVGNYTPAIPALATAHTVINPWDYSTLTRIKPQETVLILGTGLSMIDAVLTLYHQQHQGKIVAVSRHGLMPLAHSDQQLSYTLTASLLPKRLNDLTKHLRTLSHTLGDNWRAMISALRPHTSQWWSHANLTDKKRFLRHILPYWNIHRHRVPQTILTLLTSLIAKQQLTIIPGRLVSMTGQSAYIKPRGSEKTISLEMNWLINCIGPSLQMAAIQQPLLHSLLTQNLATLDPLNLGFATNASGALKNAAGEDSTMLYSLGPPSKWAGWESSAVPDIRKQSAALANVLLTES